MAESEASGEASVQDPVEIPIDGDPVAGQTPNAGDAPVADGEFEYLLDDAPAADPDGRPFDAFNATTWNFKPTPMPWHRTRQAVVAMVAVSIAVIALVVSVALLAIREPSADANLPATGTSTAPTITTAPAATTSVVSSPLPPPPPPPPPTASEIERAPVIVQPTRPTKKPELNVTRSPMSVSPQKPNGPR